jgi:hypothetical protein
MESKLLGAPTEVPVFVRARASILVVDTQAFADGRAAPTDCIVTGSDLGPVDGPESGAFRAIDPPWSPNALVIVRIGGGGHSGKKTGFSSINDVRCHYKFRLWTRSPLQGHYRKLRGEVGTTSTGEDAFGVSDLHSPLQGSDDLNALRPRSGLPLEDGVRWRNPQCQS